MNHVKLTKIYDCLKTIEILKQHLDNLHTQHLKIFVDESINNTKLRRQLYFKSAKLMNILNSHFDAITLKPSK